MIALNPTKRDYLVPILLINLRTIDQLTVKELKELSEKEKLNLIFGLTKENQVDRVLDAFLFDNYQYNSTLKINFPRRLKGQRFSSITTKTTSNETTKEPIIIKEDLYNGETFNVKVYSKEEKKLVEEIIKNIRGNKKDVSIYINYYDEIKKSQKPLVFKEDEETFKTPFYKNWKTYLYIGIFGLSLIVFTILLVFVLDLFGIIPHETTKFTEFIYRLFK